MQISTKLSSLALFAVALSACTSAPQRMPLLHEYSAYEHITIEESDNPVSQSDVKSDAQKASEKALSVYNQRKWEEARPLLMAAADLATDEEVSLRIKLLSLAARTYGLAGVCEDGRETLESARALLPQSDSEAKASFGIVDGIFIRESGDKAAAEKHFADLAQFCEEHELWAKAVDAIHHAAIVAAPEDQEKWALKGIEAAKKGGDATKGWLGALWNNLGWTYNDLGENEKALHALKEAQKAHHASSGDYQKNAADAHVAHALIRVGKINQAAGILHGVRSEAESFLAKNPSDEHWKERVHYCDWKEAEIMAARGEHAKALTLYRNAYAIFTKLNGKGWYDEWLEQIEGAANRSGGSAKE